MSQPKTQPTTIHPTDRSWLEAFGAFLERGVDRLFHRSQHPHEAAPRHSGKPPAQRTAADQPRETTGGLTA